jgi:hypothetical protein
MLYHDVSYDHQKQKTKLSKLPDMIISMRIQYVGSPYVTCFGLRGSSLILTGYESTLKTRAAKDSCKFLSSTCSPVLHNL